MIAKVRLSIKYLLLINLGTSLAIAIPKTRNANTSVQSFEKAAREPLISWLTEFSPSLVGLILHHYTRLEPFGERGGVVRHRVYFLSYQTRAGEIIDCPPAQLYFLAAYVTGLDRVCTCLLDSSLGYAVLIWISGFAMGQCRLHDTGTPEYFSDALRFPLSCD